MSRAIITCINIGVHVQDPKHWQPHYCFSMLECIQNTLQKVNLWRWLAAAQAENGYIQQNISWKMGVMERGMQRMYFFPVCLLCLLQASNSISSFSWYEQGWGSKEVELTPADMCHNECSPVLVTLHAGDIRECHSQLVSMESESVLCQFLLQVLVPTDIYSGCFILKVSKV